MRPFAPLGAALRATRRLLACAALLAVPGCASDSQVLARVGSQTIRVDDFLAAARVLGSRYPGPTDSAKVALLRDLVERELLVQGALREGLHRDTTFLDFRRRIEEQLLRQRLFEDMGAAEVAVSEAEIATLHQWRSQESRARVIVTLTRPPIEAAYAELRRGADFATVASRYNLPGIAPPGGDLGFTLPGTLQGPLDDAIRAAPVDALVGPIEVPGQYWFLVRVDERLPRELPPLRQEHDLLLSILRERKQRQILVRALNRLSMVYEVRLEPGAGQEVVSRIQPYVLREERPPEPTLNDRSQVLVRYRGGVYTLGDAIEDLTTGQAQRPNLNMLPTVERWLELRALERAALVEARRRRYQDEPAVRQVIRQRANDYLLEGYVAREVLAKAVVTEDAVRQLFAQAVAPVAPRLASARFLAAVLRDSAAAAELAVTAPQADGLREAVATAGLGIRVRREDVRYPTDHPLWQPLEGALLAVPPGGYLGPIRTPSGWVVLQLLSKREATQPTAGPSPELRAQLEQRVLEMARAARLAALTDSLRRVLPVAIYPERLRRVIWPEPMPVTEG